MTHTGKSFYYRTSRRALEAQSLSNQDAFNGREICKTCCARPDCYNLKKRPPPQPRIEITTVGELYAYLEAEKMRYMGAKSATTNASMGIECYM
ncbi:hypothetical protein TNCV_3060061 [Trichonephila clavipes]|nr:hypothetical protein TNCV_3060061 [Trichonephila clavipes]